MERLDDRSKDWAAVLNDKFAEAICAKHAVCTAIEDLNFEIVPIGAEQQAGDASR